MNANRSSLTTANRFAVFGLDSLQFADDFPVLVVNIFGIGLAENGPNQGRNHFPFARGQCGMGVAQEMTPRALPNSALQGHLDSCFELLVGVRDNQVNPVKIPVSQLGEELSPESFCFTVANINTEYFECSFNPGPVSTNPEGDHDSWDTIAPPTSALQWVASRNT